MARGPSRRVDLVIFSHTCLVREEVAGGLWRGPKSGAHEITMHIKAPHVTNGIYFVLVPYVYRGDVAS